VLTEGNPRFMAALGEDGMKTLSDLGASFVQSSQHQRFAFSPNTRYVPSQRIKSDNLWKRRGVPVTSPKSLSEEKIAEP